MLTKRSSRFLFVAVLLLTFVVHGSYIFNGFTWLDSNDIVSRAAVLPLSDLPWAFMTRYGDTGFYRPVMTISYSIDAAIYDTYAPGYHLTNVLLHVVATAGVWLFMRVFFPFTSWERALATLVFGLHPFSWLVVGSIPLRQESLLVSGLCFSVYWYTRARNAHKHALVSWLWFYFLFLCTLGTKETAVVVLPLLLLLWEIRNRSYGKNMKMPLLLIFLGIVGYVVLRSYAVPDLWRYPSPRLPFDYAIGTRLWIIGKMLFYLLWPFKAPLSDAVPYTRWYMVESLAPLLFLLVCVSVMFKKGLHHPWGLSACLFLLFLAPAADIIPVPRAGSPHYGYVPVIALGSLLVLLMRYKNHVFLTERALVLIIWLSTMAGVTFFGGFAHATNESLFAQEIVRDPAFVEGQYYMGIHALELGHLDLAAQRFSAGLAPLPQTIVYSNRQSLLINLAAVRLQQNRLDEAEKLLREALPIAPQSQRHYLHFNLALIAYERGAYQQGIDILSPYQDELTTAQEFQLLATLLRLEHRDAEATRVLEKFRQR